MRLTERAMLRIAEDLRADDLADDAGHASSESLEDQVAHRHWLKERVAAPTTAPVERVRFHVNWSGRIWRIPPFGSRS
jgi:hypothetical protein